MRARLTGVFCADGNSVDGYSPPDAEVWSLPIRMLVGPDQGPGDESSFTLVLCSPRWLEQSLRAGELRSGRHLLIARSFDPDALRARLEEIVHSIEGDDWHEVAARLARYARWEFRERQEQSHGRGPSVNR